MSFNNSNLTQYFKVLEVQRELLPSRENYSVESEFRHGKDFDGFKYNSRVITVTAIIVADTTELLQIKKRELAGLLNVTAPAKLSFSDEPDKYYFAVPTGSTEVEQVMGTGTVEITFECYDPFAFSEEEKSVSNNGKSTVKVPYTGTQQAYPVIEATMTTNNSVLAYINQNGKILQFGDPLLVDTAVEQQPESLINARSFSPASVTDGGWQVNVEKFPNPLKDGREIQAVMPIAYVDGTAGVTVGSKGNVAKYNVTSFSKVLPADKNGKVGAANFTSTFSVGYETHTTTNTGINRLELRDKNDNHVCGITFFKNSVSSNTASAYITINNTIVHNVNFQPTAQNALTGSSGGAKSFTISKYGSKFTFTVGNVSKGGYVFNFDLADLKTTEVTKIVHITGAWAGTANTMVNCLRAVSFTKQGVDTVVAAPTLFLAGDVLTADTATGLFYINGEEKMNLDTVGNQWEDFFLSFGNNEITIVQSDFASIPEVTVKYRERWL